jgi:hypothetical protein
LLRDVRLGNLEAHIEIATRGMGVRTHLMGFVDESLGLRALDARERDPQRYIKAKPALRPRTYPTVAVTVLSSGTRTFS